MTVIDAFADLSDPRQPNLVEHRLLDIVAIALCAIFAGADSWVEVEAFGRAKHAWLQTWLALPHGIPSHDTFGRLFARLAPTELAQGFARWVAALQERLPVPSPQALQVRAIDGKQSRRSHDRLHDQPALHMVSVWASETRLILANHAVDTKSNEITAIPLLLRQLDVTGCLVTIDAMGCQRAIAAQIVEQGADYVLALKDNQETLAQEVADCFGELAHDPQVQHTTATQIGKAHGRIERRQATVITDESTMRWLQERHHWPGLQAIARIDAERRFADGTQTQQTRYYLLSTALDAAACNGAVRTHWGIENQAHWILDMAFADDASRVRVGHGAENFAILRRLALNVIRQDHSKQGGVKARRLQAGWDTTYLLHLFSLVADIPC
jgi:predicted transposase YbfD/YdcC